MAHRFETQSDAILHFYRHLHPRVLLDKGIGIMNPYGDPAAWPAIRQFYAKYYSDSRPRALIFGINPGRHGAGITGIPFTDPVRLEENCGIPNDWKKKAELSSQFVYTLIDALGGPAKFYGRYHFTSLSPLGFVRHGKNLNYYDDKDLLRRIEPFVLRCIRRQLATMPAHPVCFCLGEGENYKYFNRLNERDKFFDRIVPLPHPRWVMQYRRKRIGEFIDLYKERLNAFDPPGSPSTG